LEKQSDPTTGNLENGSKETQRLRTIKVRAAILEEEPK